MDGKAIGIIILSIVLVGVIVAGVFLITNSNSEIDDLELQLSNTESELNQISGELDTANLEIESIESKNQILTSDIFDLNNQIAIMTNDMEELTLTHDNLQFEYATLDTTYQEVFQELTDIQKLYPLRDFPTRRALQDWVDEHLLPIGYGEDAMFRNACEMVELAIEDGYWIGIDMEYSESEYRYFAWCCAIANDQLYCFMPDFEGDIIAMGFYR